MNLKTVMLLLIFIYYESYLFVANKGITCLRTSIETEFAVENCIFNTGFEYEGRRYTDYAIVIQYSVFVSIFAHLLVVAICNDKVNTYKNGRFSWIRPIVISVYMTISGGIALWYVCTHFNSLPLRLDCKYDLVGVAGDVQVNVIPCIMSQYWYYNVIFNLLSVLSIITMVITLIAFSYLLCKPSKSVTDVNKVLV